jgi:hypothetical protein
LEVIGVGGKVVCSYTIEQAEKDGVLVNVLRMRPMSLTFQVTASLLSEGYRKENGEVRMANLVDLVDQAIRSIKEGTPDRTVLDWYSFDAEFPDGQKRRVFAGRNELGRLSLMLPDDY